MLSTLPQDHTITHTHTHCIAGPRSLGTRSLGTRSLDFVSGILENSFKFLCKRKEGKLRVFDGCTCLVPTLTVIDGVSPTLTFDVKRKSAKSYSCLALNPGPCVIKTGMPVAQIEGRRGRRDCAQLSSGRVKLD